MIFNLKYQINVEISNLKCRTTQTFNGFELTNIGTRLSSTANHPELDQKFI